MLLSQAIRPGGVAVIARDGSEAAVVRGAASTYALALEQGRHGGGLAEVIAAHGLAEPVDLEALAAEGLLASPIRHPDPARLHVTEAQGSPPWWARIGDGASVVVSGSAFAIHDPAPRIAEIWVIAEESVPRRVGWSLAVGGRGSLVALGPEIRIGDPPASVEGSARILRLDGRTEVRPWRIAKVVGWEALVPPDDRLRRLGDVHVHLSGVAEGGLAAMRPGEIVELHAPALGLSLANAPASLALRRAARSAL